MIMGILGILWLIIMLILWVLFATQIRRANNQSFTFAEAFKSLLIMAIVSIIGGFIWQVLLTRVIDPEYTSRVLEETMATMENLGGGEMSDDMMQGMIEGIEESTSWSSQILGIVINIAIAAVLSLIVAAIIKRDNGNSKVLDTM